MAYVLLFSYLTSPIILVVLTIRVSQVEFSVSDVEEIQWNEKLFDNIEMVDERKTLLRSLVETHVKKSFIEDFVEQKGTGLVLNFFGMLYFISHIYVTVDLNA